ncbi:MAG: hypothetical protein RLZZ127_506 [Planctomycetota bacterium]|jgi:hypothetical protein
MAFCPYGADHHQAPPRTDTMTISTFDGLAPGTVVLVVADHTHHGYRLGTLVALAAPDPDDRWPGHRQVLHPDGQPGAWLGPIDAAKGPDPSGFPAPVPVLAEPGEPGWLLADPDDPDRWVAPVTRTGPIPWTGIRQRAWFFADAREAHDWAGWIGLAGVPSRQLAVVPWCRPWRRDPAGA